ncbi:hypothetical protein [Catelliglobosispora koreensis]|uniref:hypothetical protein n=1 Tax=Catelliglobosispora koreensis TaxID=129052 RepID=UPI0012F92B15|nr:hypothetical protein [Catelliglobosispora koreensis]
MPPSPRRPAWDQDRSALPPAAQHLKGKMFHLMRARGVDAIPSPLNGSATGFAFVGGPGEKGVSRLAHAAGVCVVVDVAHYEAQMASAETPLFYTEPEGFFGHDPFYDDIIARGADLVAIPAGYVEAEDSEALKAVRDAANAVSRDDVVVVVAVDVTWLRDNRVGQLIAILRTIRHPVGLALGGQYNPTDGYVTTLSNLRRVYRELPHVGPWRTDQVNALDAMAHGALFAGIGASGSLRHLVPPKEKTFFSSKKPSVFVPELMDYFSADKLARLWANADPMTCSCRICRGGPLDRFDSEEPEAKHEAALHNLACWVQWWDELRAVSPDLRPSWLDRLLTRVGKAYEDENIRIQQAKAFIPSPTLAKLIKLAVAALANEAPVQTPVL